MDMWFLMLGCNLLLPIILLIAGFWSARGGAKRINHFLGYRTSTSMKNQETWEFAQVYSGKVMWKLGLISLVTAVVTMLCVLRASEDTICIVGLVLLYVMVVPLLLVIPLTEKALHKTFDQDGEKR